MSKVLDSIQFSDPILNIRKIVLVLTLAISFCFTVSNAGAEEMYYVFQGNITTVDNFNGLLNPGISVGDQVAYTFLIDLAVNGSYTRNNGDVLTMSDNSSYNYFYTDYISGDAFEELSDGGSHNLWYEIAEINYSSEQLSGPYIHKYNIAGNSFDNFMKISGNTFNTGDSFTAYNEVYNASGSTSFIYADVSLQSVSSSLPVVPEPVSSTLFIIGGATLGLRRFRKKFMK